MRLIQVCKADPVHGAHSVPSIDLYINRRIPQDPPSDWAKQDAEAIANALYGSLPGATIDALLAEMLTRRGTKLRVPMPGGGPTDAH